MPHFVNGIPVDGPVRRAHELGSTATASGGSLTLTVPRDCTAVTVMLQGALSSNNTNLNIQWSLGGQLVDSATTAVISTTAKRTYVLQISKNTSNTGACGVGQLQPHNGSGAAVFNVPAATQLFDGITFTIQGGSSVLTADAAKVLAFA